MTEYLEFLDSKTAKTKAYGVDIASDAIHPTLFPFQRDLTRWALRKGRCAVFADTGLGKTFIQVEWARLLGVQTLIVAPLTVARQTVREAAKIGVDVRYVRSMGEISSPISVTNYEIVEAFDPHAFGAVVLDESSILKSLAGKTRQKLTAMFAETPYRLCCTATPAPNDIAEIANHAEFLGIMSRAEMLAMYFVHDDNGWRLKGHAREPFFRWLASWGMSVRKPSDLGYDDAGYDLPPLDVQPVWVSSEYVPDGLLFNTGLGGITDRTRERRASLDARVGATVDLVRDSPEQWIVWCGLNAESSAVADAVPDAIEVVGGDTPDAKARAIEAFQDGAYRVLVTKPSICGFGMNLQNCHNMAFVGLSDSWEAYYQAVRRCWRFGQEHPVTVRIVLSDLEDAIFQNVMAKEREATSMMDNLIDNVREYERAEVGGAAVDRWEYAVDEDRGDGWRLLLGDSAERMAEIGDESVDLSVFSPPFMSLYTYSPTARDLGNSRDAEEFFTHFGYIIDQLLRVTKPGRNCCVHVAQIPAMLVRDGWIGLKDFRGDTIRAFQGHGWIYHGEVCIDKDPQAQAIRTKSKGLLFTQVHKDASWSRPALADYILVFRKPGDNAVPIVPDISNDEWIEWARPIWYGIRESDTLQYTTARSDDDERHICPLQLGTIERCIRLWSNPGEMVCSPFAGIGSEGYQALRLGRQFIGVELKAEYYQVARKNLREAERRAHMPDLFTLSGVEIA